MPKMPIIITIILVAIMIKVFKYQFAKSNIAVYQGIENFRKEVTKIHILRDKTGFQKYCNRKVNGSKFFHFDIHKFRSKPIKSK